MKKHTPYRQRHTVRITAAPLYLEPTVMQAKFLCQNRIESIEHFLLQAAVRKDMNNFPLLLVFQS